MLHRLRVLLQISQLILYVLEKRLVFDRGMHLFCVEVWIPSWFFVVHLIDDHMDDLLRIALFTNRTLQWLEILERFKRFQLFFLGY